MAVWGWENLTSVTAPVRSVMIMEVTSTAQPSMSFSDSPVRLFSPEATGLDWTS